MGLKLARSGLQTPVSARFKKPFFVLVLDKLFNSFMFPFNVLYKPDEKASHKYYTAFCLYIDKSTF